MKELEQTDLSSAVKKHMQVCQRANKVGNSYLDQPY